MHLKRYVIFRRTCVRRVIVCAAAIVWTGMVMAAEQAKDLDRAMRVSGVFENGRVVSVQVIPLSVRLPLTVTERVIEDIPNAGYFVELLDANGANIMRLRIDDPTYVLMEYADPDGGGSIVSKEIRPDRVSFSFVAPAPLGSRLLRFMKATDTGAAAPAGASKAGDVGIFALPTDGGDAVPVKQGGAK